MSTVHEPTAEPAAAAEPAAPPPGRPEPAEPAEPDRWDALRLAARRSGRRWPVAWATLVGSVGVLVQTVGYAFGWADQTTTALLLWYGGFALVVAPFAALLLAPTRTDHQRLGGALSYTLLLYASWLFYDPVIATRFDETLHVSTLVALTSGNGFFTANPTLPISPHFPGLELATGGVHWLTGMPLMAAQVAVVLVARTTFVLALFLLASRIGRSTRVGALTVLLYTASAQFYFFNAQFSYQTVAIALMVAALYLLVRAFDDPAPRPWWPLLGVQVCLAGLAVTHHVTAALALVLLWTLALGFRIGGERRRFVLTLVSAEIFTVLVLAWTAVIAPLLVDYLGPALSSASEELLLALDGSGQRSVGEAQDGASAPMWQILVMAGSIGLWLVILLPAGWRALRGSTLGGSRARLVPLGVAMAYPLLQVGRVSSAAAEVGDRLSTFVTMAMALVVGAWLVPRVHLVGRLVIPAAILLVLGGTIIGSGADWSRTPGPYLVGAQQRSIDARSVAVAEWAGRYLPAGSRVASDFTFSRLLPNFGPVVPVTGIGGMVDVTPLFMAEGIDSAEVSLIQDHRIDFVVVDERMADQLARSGALFEGSSSYGEAGRSVSTEQLTKFRDAPGFDLVLDGPVKVYDVRSLWGAPSTWADRPPPGVPGDWSPWQLGLTAALLAVALALRWRLLDPRRFRARDLWRLAVVLPAWMVLGALGVVAGYSTVAGGLTAVLATVAVVGSTPRPRRLGTGTPRRATAAWAVVILLVLGAAAVLAVTASWEGLTSFPPLPPPIGSGITP